MAIHPQFSLQRVMVEARSKLGMSQREFGPALGWSFRTAQRWDTGATSPAPSAIRKLTALLVPVDLALAQEAAAHLGETLEELGLIAPPPPPLPPPMPAAAPTSPEDLAEIVLCAAAEACDVSPRAMRTPLHIAFRRAHQLGLTVEQVEIALAPRPVHPTKKKS